MLNTKQRSCQAGRAARTFQGDFFSGIGQDLNTFVCKYIPCLPIPGQENALAWREDENVTGQSLGLFRWHIQEFESSVNEPFAKRFGQHP
jgi:hypothetical protein